jgi:hypothetical protein
MCRSETKDTDIPPKLKFLKNLPGIRVDRSRQHKLPKQIILDMDSHASPTNGNQEGSADYRYFELANYHPLFCLNQFGDIK